MKKKRTIRYRRYVHSKWTKTRALLNDAAVKGYVPATKPLTAASLREMLPLHRMVYVKPNIGAFGNGVIRVEWRPYTEKPYQYQSGLTLHRFDSMEELSRSLLAHTAAKRPYLIQQGIHLLTYRKHRFDIRVMVQKTESGSWQTTGIIGRVADPRKVVTNVHNGGTLKPVETLMAHYLSGSKLKQFIQELRTLGVGAGRALEKQFRGMKEIGVDVAVDENCRPWILEVNTAPDPYIFRKLKDKSVFRRVYRLWQLHKPPVKLKPLSARHGLGRVLSPKRRA
ncbi:YheC/YheD family protein [Paenibacillus chartarius]|uniref:YheC/YheD family protein n=1 Tax=Paenibacillus chartarius TaxID=747481 RepID=A0ABV6DRH5_9BACL